VKIEHFRIQNFRNIRLAEIADPPDFMVICGGNGCGKSALLSALMTAKEHAGSYGNFSFDAHAVSADADKATIGMRLRFDEAERDWVKRAWSEDCPERDEVEIEIQKSGAARTVRRSSPTYRLLSAYSRSTGSPGFFEYLDAHRISQRVDLSSWDASMLSDERAKQTLGAAGTQKFQFTKNFLAGLVMKDLQEIQTARRAGLSASPDSLRQVRTFFDRFFSPMKFVDVRIDSTPFQFVIETPRGSIDIDDLSAGEKEILNVYVRFMQLRPLGAVILFDEADAHLHPDLQRRYLEVLRQLGDRNQLWLTTHSPEMMVAAGADALFTVMKEPAEGQPNQLVRVSTSALLHEALSEVMGARGLVSFNQRIVFIEGDETSADREVYERLYPPGAYNVSFVPVGNSAAVRKTAERVNALLSTAGAFQQYFSIADGDIDRSLPAPAGSNRYFQLPVYHVENFLLDGEVLLQATRDMLGARCPYAASKEIEEELKRMVLEDVHLKPYAAALRDARVSRLAKEASDAVFRGAPGPAALDLEFSRVQAEARLLMEKAVADGTWKAKCKGREVLRAYCGLHGLKYEHFRNASIAKMERPPEALRAIMDVVLKGTRQPTVSRSTLTAVSD